MATDQQAEITQALAEVWGDPEAYAELVFPWGQTGTVLEGRTLRAWQRSYLRELGEEIRGRGFNGLDAVPPIRVSVASGHGIGKSALTAMLIMFVHDTCAHSRGVVTASTSAQLKARTWAELGKWRRLSLTRDRSEYFASRGNMALVNVWYPESWRVDAFTSTKENSESFQGQHSASSVSFYIFDESSSIPIEIWEAASGGLTDGLPMMFAFGNPTRNSGAFYDTHHRHRNSWRRHNIDSRDVEGASQELFDEWLETYGVDSDFFRVRVRGQFPSQASLQYIPGDLVDWSMSEVRYEYGLHDPLVYGVDVARFGDNESVLLKRRGRHVFPIKPQHRLKKASTDRFADLIMREALEDKPDAIFVDGDGVGGPLIDFMRRMNIRNITEINGASTLDVSRYYANKRAQCWGNMLEALKAGLDLPEDQDLREDLTALEYGYTLTTNKLKLESKEAAMKRGIQSPDLADALALTFAHPIGPRRAKGEIVNDHNPAWN